MKAIEQYFHVVLSAFENFAKLNLRYFTSVVFNLALLRVKGLKPLLEFSLGKFCFLSRTLSWSGLNYHDLLTGICYKKVERMFWLIKQTRHVPLKVASAAEWIEPRFSSAMTRAMKSLGRAEEWGRISSRIMRKSCQSNRQWLVSRPLRISLVLKPGPNEDESCREFKLSLSFGLKLSCVLAACVLRAGLSCTLIEFEPAQICLGPG